ncbi:MAG: hypothetical protein R2852_04490 [Bacteroidia bacterium]
MKNIFCFILTLVLVPSVNSQQIELGVGRFSSIQTVFNNGPYLHAGIGYSIGKHFMPTLSVDYLILPKKTIFQDMIILISDWNSPFSKRDTINNVNKSIKYSCTNILLNPRIYGNDFNNLNFYFSPQLGFCALKETIQYSGVTYNSTDKYATVNITLGAELGFEYSILKSKRLKIQAAVSNVIVLSESHSTDVYEPQHTNRNTIFYSARIGLAWAINKE